MSCVDSSSKLTWFVEAPNSRAISSASFTSSVWLMVANIFFSTSFLITRFAFTPSFSESSLTVMPSATVISRSIGGGDVALLPFRRSFAKNPFFLLPLARRRAAAAGLTLMAALSVGTGVADSGRKGVVGCIGRCPGRRIQLAGEGMPGPPRICCGWPGRMGPRKIGWPGVGTAGPRRTRTRRSRYGRPSLLLLQTRQYIGPWRHDRAGGRLTDETGALRTRSNRRTGSQIGRPRRRERDEARASPERLSEPMAPAPATLRVSAAYSRRGRRPRWTRRFWNRAGRTCGRNRRSRPCRHGRRCGALRQCRRVANRLRRQRLARTRRREASASGRCDRPRRNRHVPIGHARRVRLRRRR